MSEYDYVLDNMEDGDIEQVIAFLNDLWPLAVIQAADTGGSGFPLSTMGAEISRNKEFFVCRADARHSWELHGRTEDNDVLMVHVLVDPDSFTFVWSDEELGDKLVKHIKDQRIERRVMERLRSKLQLEHARQVYEAVEQHIQGWNVGHLNDNDTKRMAKLAGVALHPPVFLQRILETLHRVVLEDEC